MAQAQPERKMEVIKEQFPGSLQDKEQKQKEMIKPMSKRNQTNVVTTTTCSSNNNSTDTKTTHHQSSSTNVANVNNNSNISGSHGSAFKFNVQAPEFVPRSHPKGPGNASAASANALPVNGYFYPWFNYLGVGPDWFLLGDQHQDPASSASPFFVPNASIAVPGGCPTKNTVLTDDLRQKIVKQVEYQFSDMSLLANESMSRHISKDPEGYVPISVIASTKKMKSLVSNINLLTQSLYSSSKLVVSEDAKKVKRKVPFSEKDREELQSRTVVVENLPEDHSHQNLEKICSVVGNVKTIRICHPQDSNSSRSKSDFFVSNKIHALVEFESPEIAEKAAEQLSDERNWRKGLRVRLLLRCSPKSVLKTRRSEFDGILDDDDDFSDSVDGSPQHNNSESVADSNAEDSSAALKKGWGKGRGKGKGRGLVHGGRGLLAPSPLPAVNTHLYDPSSKPASRGPRMPDGTKGFTMGRGRPLGSLTPTSPAVE